MTLSPIFYSWFKNLFPLKLVRDSNMESKAGKFKFQSSQKTFFINKKRILAINHGGFCFVSCFLSYFIVWMEQMFNFILVPTRLRAIEVKVKSLGHVWLLATPWTAAYQASPSMWFSRQEYWRGVPLPSQLQMGWHTFLKRQPLPRAYWSFPCREHQGPVLPDLCQEKLEIQIFLHEIS